MNSGPTDVTAWLLEGDPAIRWQVMRDLLGKPPKVWEQEQHKVATKGWGARLLSHRGSDGRWTARLYGYKWISTTYSMVLLRRMGLPQADPRAVASCRLFGDEGVWPDGGINLSTGQKRSEVCISGFVLGLWSWFRIAGPARERLVEFLLASQMDDGGWNCEWDRGATHSSFHTTISVLEGLREYDDAGGPNGEATRRAEALGREFFAEHRMFRSHRDGSIVDDKMLRLSFPPRWRHDVLRGLDYFRAAGARPDERLSDAVEVVVSKRRRDGRWPLQQRYAGRTWFEMEQPGKPSRWNTMRALRVLDWWRDAG